MTLLKILRTTITTTILLLLAITASRAEDEDPSAADVSFVNFFHQPITLYWLDEDDNNHPIEVGILEPFESQHHTTFLGHQFTYTIDEEPVVYIVTEEFDVHAMGVPASEQVPVLCSTTQGDLHIAVKPTWSPLGAARFLDLISDEYFDGCALNRVVRGFLTQFGISADYEQRTEYRKNTIPDDLPSGVEFEPGYMAYAGSGPNSRTTEMFIVMPDTPKKQLQAFGDNPWETAFAYVDPEDVRDVVAKWYAMYGDMPPWGKGPDPQKMYAEDGYVYLKQEFPEMDYINSCWLVEEEEVEQEF